MERKIISHDTKTAIATVQFDHNGVSLEQTIDLKMVVPGSMHVFEQMGIEFSKAHQLKALATYTASIELQIEQGVITNPAKPETPEYTPPESVEVPEESVAEE